MKGRIEIWAESGGPRFSKTTIICEINEKIGLLLIIICFFSSFWDCLRDKQAKGWVCECVMCVRRTENELTQTENFQGEPRTNTHSDLVIEQTCPLEALWRNAAVIDCLMEAKERERERRPNSAEDPNINVSTQLMHWAPVDSCCANVSFLDLRPD